MKGKKIVVYKITTFYFTPYINVLNYEKWNRKSHYLYLIDWQSDPLYACTSKRTFICNWNLMFLDLFCDKRISVFIELNF